LLPYLCRMQIKSKDQGDLALHQYTVPVDRYTYHEKCKALSQQ
jgi:hypothetical protein